MGFITAIDKAINKGHYANEAEKQHQRQMEENRQFMEMLDNQNAQFAKADEEMWKAVGQQSDANDQIFNQYMGGNNPVLEAGGMGGGNGGKAAMPEMASMMATPASGGAANAVMAAGGMEGGMTSASALALPSAGAGAAVPSDPLQGLLAKYGSESSSSPDNLKTLEGFKGTAEGSNGRISDFANSATSPGYTGSAAEVMKAGGVDPSKNLNMNDLIDYFDQKQLEKDRPAGMEQDAMGKAGEKGDMSEAMTVDDKIDALEKELAELKEMREKEKMEDEPLESLRDIIKRLVDAGILSEAEGEKMLQALDNAMGLGEEAPAMGGGEAPAMGGGAPAPAAGGGEAAPAKGEGEAAPAEGEGGAAPAAGGGEAAPAKGEAAPAAGGSSPAQQTQNAKLGQLADLSDRAQTVMGEIDQRVDAGQLSSEVGEAAKDRIMGGLKDAKNAIMKEGDTNMFYGHEITDDEIVSSFESNLNAVDKNLDKLAASDVKADSARNKIADLADKGKISQADAKGGMAMIDEQQTQTELAVLGWT